MSDEKILELFNRTFILYELRLIANELKRQDIIKRKAFQTPIALYNNNNSELSSSNVNLGAGKNISDIVKNSDNIFNINIMVKDIESKTSMPYTKNNNNIPNNSGVSGGSGSTSINTPNAASNSIANAVSNAATNSVTNSIANAVSNAAIAAESASIANVSGGGGVANAMSAVGGGGAVNSANAAAALAATTASTIGDFTDGTATGGTATGGTGTVGGGTVGTVGGGTVGGGYVNNNTQDNNIQTNDSKFSSRIYNPINYKFQYRGDMINRPNVCSYGTKQIVQPIFLNSSTLFQGTDLKEAAENTQVGSIMPKFEYYEYEDVI